MEYFHLWSNIEQTNLKDNVFCVFNPKKALILRRESFGVSWISSAPIV